MGWVGEGGGFARTPRARVADADAACTADDTCQDNVQPGWMGRGVKLKDKTRQDRKMIVFLFVCF